MGKKLWFAGKCIDDKTSSWEFQGVFTTEEKAVLACYNHKNWFIAPAILDDVLPEKSIEMSGAYYPSEKEHIIHDNLGNEQKVTSEN